MSVIQIGYCGNASLFFLFSCQERQDLKRVKVVVHLKVIFWGAKEGTCPLSPPWLCPWWKVKHQNISCWEFPNLWYVKIRKKTITLHNKLHGPAVCLHPWSWSNFTILRKFYKMWQCSFFLNATNHILKQKYLYPTQQIHNELKRDNFFLVLNIMLKFWLFYLIRYILFNKFTNSQMSLLSGDEGKQFVMIWNIKQ